MNASGSLTRTSVMVVAHLGPPAATRLSRDCSVHVAAWSVYGSGRRNGRGPLLGSLPCLASLLHHRPRTSLYAFAACLRALFRFPVANCGCWPGVFACRRFSCRHFSRAADDVIGVLCLSARRRTDEEDGDDEKKTLVSQADKDEKHAFGRCRSRMRRRRRRRQTLGTGRTAPFSQTAQLRASAAYAACEEAERGLEW